MNVVSYSFRSMKRRPRPCENSPRPSEASLHQRGQRLLLALVRAFIDEPHALAVAFMNRAGPFHVQSEIQFVEADIVEATAVDVPGPAAFTVALRRLCVEIARTAKIAVARHDRRAAQPPGCSALRGHASLLKRVGLSCRFVSLSHLCGKIGGSRAC